MTGTYVDIGEFIVRECSAAAQLRSCNTEQALELRDLASAIITAGRQGR